MCVVATMIVAGCSGSTGGVGSAVPSSPASSATTHDFPSTSPSASLPQPHVLVQVPGGVEAATYDEVGNIRFWRNPSTTWQQVGRSTYPFDAQLGESAPSVKVTGALISGMKDATFIVHGTFTTDGGGNAVAFTDGANGWGVIKAQPDGNLAPSGQPVGNDRIGLSFDLAFVDGKLQTKDCPTDRPLADCAGHPVSKLWVWSGQDFRRA